MNWEVLKGMTGVLALILVAQAVFFVIVVGVLRKLLLGDTLEAVRRLKTAETDLARKEEAMRQKMEAHDQEFQQKKAEAEQELERQRQSHEQDLARMKDRMKAEAKTEADRIISEAQLNKDRMRDQLLREASGKAIEYAGELFRMVVSQQISQKLNVMFVDELMTALSEIDATSVPVDGSQAEFTSSHRLEAAQRERLERLLAEKFNVTIKVNEKVDESLLAGLVIKMGTLEIDGSLLNRYREAVAELKKAV